VSRENVNVVVRSLCMTLLAPLAQN